MKVYVIDSHKSFSQLEKGNYKPIVEEIKANQDADFVEISSAFLTKYYKDQTVIELLNLLKQHLLNLKGIRFEAAEIFNYKERGMNTSNRIGMILSGFSKLQHLEVIGLGDSVNLFDLIKHLSDSPLKELHLVGLSIGLMPDFDLIIQKISQIKSLYKLNLSYNSIGLKTGDLLNALSKCRTLKSLNISRNNLNKDIPSEYLEGNFSCPDLLKLDLSYNYIGEKSLNKLKKMLNNEFSQLVEFKFDNCLISEEDINEIKDISTRANSKAIRLIPNRFLTFKDDDFKYVNENKLVEKEKMDNLMNHWYDSESEISRVPSLQSILFKHFIRLDDKQGAQQSINKLNQSLHGPFVIICNDILAEDALENGNNKFLGRLTKV